MLYLSQVSAIQKITVKKDILNTHACVYARVHDGFHLVLLSQDALVWFLWETG